MPIGKLQPGEGRQLRWTPPSPPAFSQILLLLSWLEDEVLQRDIQSSSTFPALVGLAACSTTPFLGEKARGEQGWKPERMREKVREGPYGGEVPFSPLQTIRSCAFSKVPLERHFMTSLPSLLPWECWALGLGDGLGEWSTPLPDQTRKPLTSTTGTITQGPNSLKLRRADPSLGKYGHALSLSTKVDSPPTSLGPLRGPVGGS